MWKKYWKFNDWVFEKVTGEKVDSMQEWKEVPERWRRFKKEPFKYIRPQEKISAANVRHAYKVYKFLKSFKYGSLEHRMDDCHTVDFCFSCDILYYEIRSFFSK